MIYSYFTGFGLRGVTRSMQVATALSHELANQETCPASSSRKTSPSLYSAPAKQMISVDDLRGPADRQAIVDMVLGMLSNALTIPSTWSANVDEASFNPICSSTPRNPARQRKEGIEEVNPQPAFEIAAGGKTGHSLPRCRLPQSFVLYSRYVCQGALHFPEKQSAGKHRRSGWLQKRLLNKVRARKWAPFTLSAQMAT